MKQSEIKVGKFYKGKSGRVRLVTSISANEEVCYIRVNPVGKIYKSPAYIGEIWLKNSDCKPKSFARWAKVEVEAPGRVEIG
jgi:hypothetical protein